jgi:hypothetical protein
MPGEGIGCSHVFWWRLASGHSVSSAAALPSRTAERAGSRKIRQLGRFSPLPNPPRRATHCHRDETDRFKLLIEWTRTRGANGPD